MKKFFAIAIPVAILAWTLWNLGGYAVSVMFAGAMLPDKEQITGYYNENKGLLSEAVADARAMENTGTIAMAPDGGLEEDKQITGLYATSGVPGEGYRELDDPGLEQLFKDKIVGQIIINDTTVTFDCGNNSRETYRGLYYSLDGGRYDMDGIEQPFTQTDGGWEYSDDSVRVTLSELGDNWYYYEQEY